MSTLFVDTINEKTTNNGVYIPGHVLQAVSGTLSAGISTTSGTMAATGLKATITPSTTSSKIYVEALRELVPELIISEEKNFFESL